jgi:hypothetical protein
MHRGPGHAFGDGGLERIEGRRVVAGLKRAATGFEMFSRGFAVRVSAGGTNNR